jgi:hypothetical protein
MFLPSQQDLTPGTFQPGAVPFVETLLEKGSGRLNEDVLIQAGDIFGVFDGATSLFAEPLPQGLTGGLLAARIAAETFRQNGRSLPRCAALANRRISDGLRKNGVPADERHRLWSTSAAVIRLGDTHFDYCQTGDCMIFCLYRDGRYRQLTPVVDHDQETLALWKKMPPKSDITIRDALFDHILSVRLQMNVRYGVLNGEPKAMDFLQHGREPLDGIGSILLFTDGLFIPREDPHQECDWDTLIHLYRKGGLKMIRDHVRSLQQQDTGCRIYPRFKIHDDIAAIAVRLNV